MKTFLTVLFATAVIVLGAVTAIANFRYGLLIGAGEERWIYAIGGTVLDVVKTFLPLAMGTFLVGPLTAGLFFRHLAGWGIFALGVIWSLTCALGLYAIVKEAKVGDTVGHKALYDQLRADKGTKEARVVVLGTAKAFEVIEGEVAAAKMDRAYSSSNGCLDATATKSRDLCARIATLTASLATAPKSADIQTELATLKADLVKIDAKLGGMDLADVLKKADPAGEALAKFIGWDVETVKSRLAFLIAVLFESSGFLLWIVHGSHTRRATGPQLAHIPAPELAPLPAQPLAKPPKFELEEVAELAPVLAHELALDEEEAYVAAWARTALVRRKGSFVPSAEIRSDYEAWCRINGHEALNPTAFGREMTRLGFKRQKRGHMRYVDVGMIPKARELKLAVSN